MDLGPIHLDGRQTDEPRDRLQGARDAHRRPDIAAVEAVGVEVAVTEPAGTVGAPMARERSPSHRDGTVVLEAQAQRDPVEGGAVGDEGEVEGGTVPRRDDAGLELGEAIVEVDEQLVLGTGEDLFVPGPGEGHRDHGRHSGVEPVLRGVGFDVESVHGWSPTHSYPRTSCAQQRRNAARPSGGCSGQGRQPSPGMGRRVSDRRRRATSGLRASSRRSSTKVTTSSPSPGRTSVMRAPLGRGGRGR